MNHAILTAIYADEREAHRSRDALTSAGFPAGSIRIASPQVDASAARAESRMHSESGHAERGLVMTNVGLWGGAAIGTVAGLVIGALIFGIGMLATSAAPGGTGAYAVASLVGGAAAGSVGGGLLGAFASFTRRRADEETDLHGVVLRITLGDDAQERRAMEILRTTAATHIERQRDQRRAG